MRIDEHHPSLRPPLHGYYRSEAEAPRTSWALLDRKAYIADRDNYTSACCKLSDGTQIRVTFCAAPPPLVSYLCVWCPDLPPSEFAYEPKVLAVESDLLLLEVTIRLWREPDHLVYKAYDGSSGPSLQLLHLPDPCIDNPCSFSLVPRRDIHQAVDGDSRGFGLFTHGADEDSSSRFSLRRCGDEDRYYYVAVFYYDKSSSKPDYSFKLWVFDSEKGQWSSRLISVHCPVHHITTKVISLGGEDGLLGFVDPWRGIVVCDILGRRSSHYLPLPAGFIANDMLYEPALLSRDIALVEGRLTFVDLHPSARPDINHNFHWKISTWSRKVTDLWEEDWRNDYNVCSPDISVDQVTQNVSLLPVLKDSQGELRPTLARLYTAHPVLSLSHSPVVYIMAKPICDKKKALVLSIDLAEPRLQGVDEFAAERMVGRFSYSWMQSWIPKYFNPGRSLKRSGDFHAVYLRKLKSKIDEKSKINEMRREYLDLPIDVEEEGSGGKKGAEHDNDIMDVDL